MTTEHASSSRLRAALRELGQILVSAVLVAFAVGSGALAATYPVVVPGFLVGYGGMAVLIGYVHGFDGEQWREEGVVFVLMLAMHATALAAKLAEATAVEPVATLALGVTVAVAGVAVHILSFEDNERVPYLSHYVETGAWSA